ncbi:MAG: hypothetical protein KBT87_04860 [Gammaproteobacteria bacterium]|jgi:hypothetical protein|nr:hypothetical protein [Gammaproteobacteria bacterium]MBQ0773984.1 hypothetical protein [Gammaproteobacteria bacterium]|tara:strand:+ start:22294 stop:22704 length:411 start_codon:yes stop_codon:yes gene_type:complete
MRLSIFSSYFAITLLIFTSPPLRADENSVFQYDSKPTLRGDIRFNQDNPKQVKRHDFEVVDYALMSNEQGERWATVTFKNTSTGQRLLANEYLLAEFADGTQRFALNLDGKVESGQVLTRTVFFGYHRFPILRLQW